MSDLPVSLTKACPECGKAMHLRAKHCPHCRAEKGDGPATSAATFEALPATQLHVVKEDDLPEGYVALADFRAVIPSGQAVQFKKGQQIAANLVFAFRRDGLPIASPDEVDRLFSCPHCRQIIDLDSLGIVGRAAPAA